MGLARHQQEVDQPSGRIAHTDDLGAEAPARTTQRFSGPRNVASESQTQLGALTDALPVRAPDAF